VLAAHRAAVFFKPVKQREPFAKSACVCWQPLSREHRSGEKSHPENFNKRVKTLLETDIDPFDFEGLNIYKNSWWKQSHQRSAPACIIISASGMADAGRIKPHIMNNINDAKILFLL